MRYAARAANRHRFITDMVRPSLAHSGSDAEIRENFRKFVKDDQFERAAAVADISGLSPRQVAEREGHILKVDDAGR